MEEPEVTRKVQTPDIRSISSSLPNNVEEAGSREAFLASFSREDDKAIMKKNIDYQNGASVKVLQVGEPRNILTELNMTSDQYNWVQSIYFISYILFEVPSNLMLKRMTPRVWQSRIILSWGIVLACHAAIQSKESYYGLRFLLSMM
ncbi:putative MFS transporter superfamily [Septoria linicola]|nr:putative MFS transporter superfamily [Septoria linicola]